MQKFFVFFLSEGMNFSFGRRQEKVDWRRLGEKLESFRSEITANL